MVTPGEALDAELARLQSQHEDLYAEQIRQAMRMDTIEARLDAADAPPITPDPPTPPDGDTIWTTRIAQNADLRPSGLTATPTVDGKRYTSGMTIDMLHVRTVDTRFPMQDVWECQERPTHSTPPKRQRLIARLPLDPNFVHDPKRSNDLSVYVDDADGTISGVGGAILTGGGTTTRPSKDGPTFHNWEVPPRKYQDEMGTVTSPGRAGQTGAARISAIGTYVKRTEYDRAIGGDETAIEHVLGLLVWGKAFLSREGGGKVWPAYDPDGSYANPKSGNYYNGSIPYMRMGSLLALPDRITAAELPILGKTGRVPNLFRALAEVLFTHGGVVCDNTAWQAYAIKMDAQIGDDIVPDIADRQAFARMIAMCDCVVSNGPDTVGGGPAGSSRR